MDVAKAGRIPHRDNGFGTTLGRWGAQPGPYIFLPLIGPSTLRDSFGSGVDVALNPFTYVRYDGKWEVDAALTITDGLQARVSAGRDIETIRQTSTDPYATLRSYYLQSREARIHGAATTELPDFDTPDATGAPAAPGAPKTTTAPALPDIESEPEPPAAPDAAAPPAPPAPADAAPAPVPEAPAAPPAPPAPDR
jgi:phospholipid-binding lipoprotein MlaA